MKKSDWWARKNLMVSLISLALGAALAALGLQALDVPVDPGAPPTATFDVFRWTEAGVEPLGTLTVALKDGEYMMAAKPGEPRYIYVVCEEGSDTNPCGPGGYAPDRYGAVVAEPVVNEPVE